MSDLNTINTLKARLLDSQDMVAHYENFVRQLMTAANVDDPQDLPSAFERLSDGGEMKVTVTETGTE